MPTDQQTDHAWTDLLDRAVDDFVDVVEAATDLAAPVPSCPEWTLAGLVDHLRFVHWWAAHAITEGNPKGSAPEVGRDKDALIAGYVSAADHLLDVLSSREPTAPAWTFGPEQNVAFWLRRQTHEVTMHLYDALGSQGRAGDWPITPELAWDGVREVAEVMYPRQVRLERTAPLPGTLRLRATDLGTELSLGEGGTGDAGGEISGTAADVLLTVWRRRAATDATAASLLDSTAVTP